MTDILIVEDSLTQAAHLRHILEKHGYAVSVAHNGAEAIARLREHRPTVVVSDIMMPVMDGYQLCQRIKHDPALKDILVVLLTALSDPEDIIRGLECGADNFIVKPYEEHALLSRIRDILANRDLRTDGYADEGIEVYFAGRKRAFTARPTHVVDLLLSTYETSVQQSRELIRVQDELRALNQRLEEKVAELTAVNAERERLLAAEQEARRQAEAATRIRDEFMSIAAHELKTPVTSLQGYAQIMLRELVKTGAVDPTRLVKSMQHIEQQSKRLTKLTEQLLNLSRLRAGKLTLSHEETDLSALIGGVVAAVQHAHPHRPIKLWNAAPGSAFVDPLRIEQVLTNLLDNALKFSPSDSCVEVQAEASRPGWVTISVRDSGIGIPREKQERIFERFYQAHAERHYGGMGIGLFVSREIVEMHGGTISVEQPEDGGSRFVVRLPVQRSAELTS